MSMRQRVGRQEIEQFLIQVGRTRNSSSATTGLMCSILIGTALLYPKCSGQTGKMLLMYSFWFVKEMLM